MSRSDGLAALRCARPGRIPRTEYSAEMHHELIARVIGCPPDEADSDAARSAFVQAWDYGLVWAVAVDSAAFGGQGTDMGHAVYAADGSDRREAGAPAFAEPEDLLAFDPALLPRPDHAAMVARFDAHYAGQCRLFPDAVTMTGIYITLVSGLIELAGWETLLLAAGIDREGFGALAGRYADWVEPYVAALADSAAPVVMLHDDLCWSSGPFLPPAWYDRYVFPRLQRFVEILRDAGKTVLFTSDGDIASLLPGIGGLGVAGICFEPCTDLELMVDRLGQDHALIGGVDTRVLLQNDAAAIEAAVDEAIGIAGDCPGFILAVGNHIPANTPVEAAMVYDAAYRRRRDR